MTLSKNLTLFRFDPAVETSETGRLVNEVQLYSQSLLLLYLS